MASLATALRATPLTATHRYGYEKHHEHDCDRHDNHHDTGTYREHGDEGAAQLRPPCLILSTSAETAGVRSRGPAASIPPPANSNG
jgi:hypothetical protein